MNFRLSFAIGIVIGVSLMYNYIAITSGPVPYLAAAIAIGLVLGAHLIISSIREMIARRKRLRKQLRYVLPTNSQKE
jgi:xanthosine utilization system XapX-like protein